MKKNTRLKKRNDQLQELNISLQTQLLSLLNANGSLAQTPPTEKLPELAGVGMNKFPKDFVDANEGDKFPELAGVGMNKFPKDFVDANEGGSLLGLTPPPQGKPNTLFMTDLSDQEKVKVIKIERNSASKLKGSNPSETPAGLYLHDNGNLMKWKDEQMELAPGVFIKKDQWLKIATNKNINESRLTRNLAVSLWGSETLKDRSVTGSACRRFKKDGIQPKMALTPIKVDAVQNGLRYWLTEHQGKEEQEALKLSSTSAVRKMLSDKIMDLTKQQKKK